MREKDNIVGICKDCNKKIKEKTQKELLKKPLDIGDFVKIKLGNGKTVEHCWFEVLEIKNSVFLGRLDNYTCYIQEIDFGDKKWFSIKEIEDIIRRDIINKMNW